MLKKSLCYFFTFFIFLFNCTYAAKPDCIALNPSANFPVKKILEYVNFMVFAQSNVPAMMIGIVDGNQTLLISCGETVVGNNIWAIGSVSKVITTTILAKMLVENKVALTDPVARYVPPGIKVPVKDNRAVTLLDLATHTAGFVRSPPFRDEDMNDYQHNYAYPNKEAYEWLSKSQLQTVPGTHYLYSNFGFGLLGQSLAFAAKTTYADLVQKYVAIPLGMKDTTVKLSEEQKKREVKSYWMNGDLIPIDWAFDFEQPSGGVYSSAHDLFRFVQYHLNLLTPDPIANQMSHATYVYQNMVNDPYELKNSGIALAWHVDEPHQELPLLLNKNGWVSGFNTWVWISPTTKMGIFSLTNKPYLAMDGDLKTILGMVIANKKGQ